MRSDFDRIRTALAGRYDVEREIGGGGMAVVYLARDVKHDRDVALKVLRPEVSRAVGPERFLREIAIAAKLHHPNVLPLFDSGVADDLLYYVAPYATGETLREILTREGQLDVEVAVRLAGEIAAALDAAHRQDVVHRDIKPENILVQDGAALVADFGIATTLAGARGERLTETGLAIGTPNYMSPEQATGEHDVDRRSDVYAIGAVVYEMLAGEPPHNGPNAQATIAKIIAEPPVPLRRRRKDVPRAVDAAVIRALQKQPADRFDSARELAAALRSSTPPAPRLAKTVMASLAVAIVVSAVGVAAWLGRETPNVVDAEPSIAVLPADARGEASLVAAGLDVLLAAGVDGVPGWRAVSPRTVMARWSERVTANAADLETSLDVARATGARYAVLPTAGDLVTGFRLAAEVYDLADGARIGVAESRGARGTLTTLAQDLAIQSMSKILQGTGDIAIDLARVTSASVDAVAAFLEGEVLFRDYQLRRARDAYLRALKADSAFALVHARLTELYAWGETLHRDSSALHLRLAGRFAERLAERERIVVQARLTPDARVRARMLRDAVPRPTGDATH